jgi:hypothetical protein
MFKQSHEMQSTLKECLRELTEAIGHHDYELTGDRIIVRDDDRQLVIHLVYEGDRHLGSLDLPMVRLDYEFTGYTKAEMDEFMEHLYEHMQRLGG